MKTILRAQVLVAVLLICANAGAVQFGDLSAGDVLKITNVPKGGISVIVGCLDVRAVRPLNFVHGRINPPNEVGEAPSLSVAGITQSSLDNLKVLETSRDYSTLSYEIAVKSAAIDNYLGKPCKIVLWQDSTHIGGSGTDFKFLEKIIQNGSTPSPSARTSPQISSQNDQQTQR